LTVNFGALFSLPEGFSLAAGSNDEVLAAGHPAAVHFALDPGERM